MTIHRLTVLRRDVVHFDAAREFYRQFGLEEREPGAFRTANGGEQLLLSPSSRSRITEIGVGADTLDDVETARSRLGALGLDCDRVGGDVVTREPVMDIVVRVSVSPRVADPGPPTPRTSVDRAELVARTAVTPLRLGHIVLGCVDVVAAAALFLDGLGMRTSDHVAGGIFMRFGTDHHNVCLLRSERNFLHHTAWKVRSLDEVGYGARNVLDADAERDGWGLGRHAASANYFWYLRDPEGSFAEYYFSELDDLAPDDAFWDPDPDVGELPLAAWGPDLPDGFLTPPAMATADGLPQHAPTPREAVAR